MERIVCALTSAVVLVVASGCASKAWVERELDKRDARLDRTFASAAASREEASVVDQRLQSGSERIRLLEARTDDLDARTTMLEARAEDLMVHAAAPSTEPDRVGARLTMGSSEHRTSTVVNTLQVEFRFNRATLDDSAKSMLQAIVRELRDSPELTLDLEGYTDTRGSRQYNLRLSQKRVDAVRAYLIEQGVEPERIKTSARGPAADASAVPDGRKRRVDVKLVASE